MNDLINIKNKDVISIVGSGGKTSLLYNIAKSTSNNKVLVSTTTKIRIPDNCFYDYIAFNEQDSITMSKSKNKGIYILANKLNDEKLESIEIDILEKIVDEFDLTILEADGSKEKLIKGWNDTEPVILEKTTKTIGIVNLDVVGKIINDENIHRIDKFLDITCTKINDLIDKECLIKLIMNKNGLFKNSKGQKILFINAVETKEKMILAQEISKKLRHQGFELDYIIAGSIVEGVFFNI
ncbi:MAG: selenium cofactor biosynthesis protein YqeC [Sarcina sp.]